MRVGLLARLFAMAPTKDPASATEGSMPSNLRSTVSLARGDATSSDHMQNLAYVVSSANDNIQALQRTIKQQEKAYRKDFFKFAKEACNGTLFEKRVEPEFNVEEASTFFNRRYGAAAMLDMTKLDWMIDPPPPTVPYNSDAVRPCQVKKDTQI